MVPNTESGRDRRGAALEGRMAEPRTRVVCLQLFKAHGAVTVRIHMVEMVLGHLVPHERLERLELVKGQRAVAVGVGLREARGTFRLDLRWARWTLGKQR